MCLFIHPTTAVMIIFNQQIINNEEEEKNDSIGYKIIFNFFPFIFQIKTVMDHSTNDGCVDDHDECNVEIVYDNFQMKKR